jgi:hypothetical protein
MLAALLTSVPVTLAKFVVSDEAHAVPVMLAAPLITVPVTLAALLTSVPVMLAALLTSVPVTLA